MEISDLRIFQAVAELGSVSKAAKELNYVQSNVTARIQQMELKLGTELFYRHRRGMSLNPEGKKLLGYTQKILAMMEEMKLAFQDEEDPSGPLLVGSVETVSCLPDILSAYHKKYPRVDLSLMTGCHGAFDQGRPPVRAGRGVCQRSGPAPGACPGALDRRGAGLDRQGRGWACVAGGMQHKAAPCVSLRLRLPLSSGSLARQPGHCADEDHGVRDA